MVLPRRIAIGLAALLCAAACRRDDRSPVVRFVVIEDAVVRDTETRLEWTRRDDGRGLEWHAAEAYCRSLSIDDAGGWRLPTIEELHGLYGTPRPIPCGTTTCEIDPAFSLSSPYVWSGTVQHVTARTYLDFQFGTRLSPTITPALVRRVLCVRKP
jgi:hypothetical protein